ncbi:uncharacterized protein LOC119568650 [Penaeus monodon]|uniref:uncharacterized protein LOC119568650 n=1 Tax=Penaeus monodon TaxID=6687 RepID=UPI0018A6F81D|nr:uncharacterized protein LOC119568650 [Penaeus monodon]
MFFVVCRVVRLLLYARLESSKRDNGMRRQAIEGEQINGRRRQQKRLRHHVCEVFMYFYRNAPPPPPMWRGAGDGRAVRTRRRDDRNLYGVQPLLAIRRKRAECRQPEILRDYLGRH